SLHICPLGYYWYWPVGFDNPAPIIQRPLDFCCARSAHQHIQSLQYPHPPGLPLPEWLSSPRFLPHLGGLPSNAFLASALRSRQIFSTDPHFLHKKGRNFRKLE